MYCEWYGVCDFVVLSVVEVCANYGGVNVFHVCPCMYYPCRYDWMFALAMFMSLCVDVMVMSSA